MSRVRVSTTVDDELLARARSLRAGLKDSELLDEALASLLARHHKAQLDAEIGAGYDLLPIDTPDEWGDLESWNEANDVSPAR